MVNRQYRGAIVNVIDGRIRLTAKERHAFFARDWPLLAAEGKPPELTQRHYRLSPRLAFTITRIHRTRKGYRLEYDVVDDREERFFLLPAAMSVPPTDERGEFIDGALPPEEEIGYTQNPKRRRCDELPTVRPNVQSVLSMRARLTQAERTDHGEELAKRQARSINENVRDVLLQRARLGLPADSPALADLHRALEAMRAELEIVESAA